MKKLFLLLLTCLMTTFTFGGVILTEPKVIYFNAGAIYWWTSSNAVQRAVVDGTNIIGVLEYGSVYAFTIPAGLHETIRFERAEADNVPAWNKTGDIQIAATYNYVASFSENSSTATWQTYIQPDITLKGDFNNWGNGDKITFKGSKTATFVKNISAGSYGFKIVKGEEDWKSNNTTITRANSGTEYDFTNDHINNAILAADYDGDYTFTYTYATRTLSVTFPPLPAKSVDFDGLGTQILKGSVVNFAATSTGVNNAGYRYYVKPANGDYGDALTSYTFNTNGEYVVKVEALENNTGEPVVSNEKEVSVYETYTFTAGTRIYVDFSAMTEGAKGVNYPYQNTNSELDYDVNGAGTTKIVLISQNVTWSTLDDFIKTEKNGWAGLKFTAPGEGQNKITVAADGASYTWGTHATAHVKFFAPRTEQNLWTSVYAYSWDDAGNLSAAFPGDEITSTKNAGWYEYDVPVGASVIFNDGAGMQTNNIENIQADVCYVPTAVDNEANPKMVTVATDADCKVEYYIAGTKELIGGTDDFGTNLALDENNQITFENVPAGDYEFKININNWAWALGGNDHLKSGECATIAKTVGIGNVGFTIDHTQNVTITYFPETEEICLGAVTVKSSASVSVANMTVYVSKAKTINASYESDATAVQYEILTGSEYINIADGTITGVAEGTATVRASVPETDNYLGAYQDFTVTVEPLKYYLKNNWNGCDWTWKEMTAVGDGTFRLENVVYGGNGINYNFMADDADAIWKEYSTIKYTEGTQKKVVAAYDTINLVLDPSAGTLVAEMVQKDVTVYTVAGNSLALFYLGWAPTHPYKYTDMEKQNDGTYKWDNGGEDATLIAGELRLKVIKDRDYANGSWPDEDFVYNVQRSGEYQIAIHFNPCTKAISIDTTCVNPLNIQMPLLIKGSWDNWEGAANLTLGGYNDKAIVTLSLTEGTYQFKLEDVQSKWYGDGQAYTRDNNSHKDIEAKEESATIAMTIQVDKAGEYLFTYFYDGEILLVQYPAIAPAEKIAPIGGKFTINANKDTIVFSRGNLQYNYESNVWYAAEKQYDVLGDLNLRLGDNTYTGSIDLFGWSSTSSDFGKQWKYRDEEFAGDFVDWGTLFADDENEWSTLSRAEWEYLLARKKGNDKLWTFLALGPDSLNGLVLFPDNWEAPAGLTKPINYGFYDLENEAALRANSFSYAEWEAMETAGAVFLPLAASRAGYYGNTWSGSAESSLSNPLALGYDWVDEANAMGYYWTTTINNNNVNQIQTLVLPGWHNNNLYPPTYWARERRRGQSVRLVTRIPKVDYTRDVTAGNYGTICLPQAGTIEGATLYSIGSYDGSMIYVDEVGTTLAAGVPYIFYATANQLKVSYTSATQVAAGEANGLHGFYDLSNPAATFDIPEDAGNYVLYQNQYWLVSGRAAYITNYRAYIKTGEINNVQQAPGVRRVAMPVNGQNTTTGMESIQDSEISIQKVIINGQLFIIRGEKMYDATGRLVK